MSTPAVPPSDTPPGLAQVERVAAFLLSLLGKLPGSSALSELQIDILAAVTTLLGLGVSLGLLSGTTAKVAGSAAAILVPLVLRIAAAARYYVDTRLKAAVLNASVKHLSLPAGMVMGFPPAVVPAVAPVEASEAPEPALPPEIPIG